MTGGKSTPKKDIGVKVGSGQLVRTGQIIVRGKDSYKAGINVRGLGTLFSLCSGKIYFTRKKTSHGRMKTFINVQPVKDEPKE